MKKLSKIVALLLAGALTMLLFTACSGGGGDGMATKKTEEDKVISLVKKDHSNAVVTKSKNFSPFPPERGCKAALRGFCCVWGQLPKRTAEFGRYAC